MKYILSTFLFMFSAIDNDPRHISKEHTIEVSPQIHFLNDQCHKCHSRADYCIRDDKRVYYACKNHAIIQKNYQVTLSLEKHGWVITQAQTDA